MLKKLSFYASGTIFVKVVLLSIVGIASGVHAQIWIEDTFDDFSDGILDASGQNIYVSRSNGILPVHGAKALTVDDLNDNGFLDIFLAHYHAELRRELLPSYLYWGGRDGFHTRRRTALVNDSAADGFVGDFDCDGLLDLVVANHTIDGNHNAAVSKVYYNDGKRFTNPQRIEYLPSPGAHWMWNEDMGHIYTRKWEQTYISSIFHWKDNAAGGKINFKADVPAGTKLTIAVRSAATEESLTEKSWRTFESGVYRLKASDRCMQYRAAFISDNGDRYPVLDRVMVTLNQ